MSSDPLGILTATQDVVAGAQYVFLNYHYLETAARAIKAKLQGGLESAENYWGSGVPCDIAAAVQRVFLEDTVNFCYWAEAGREPWHVKWPENEPVKNGRYALAACFNRALGHRVPILNADFLAAMTLDQAAEIFAGDDESVIPLLSEPLDNLRQAGQVLSEKYRGSALNILNWSIYDAVELARILREDFMSFNDVAILGRQHVPFLKRAQLCARDLASVVRIYNTDLLTACADYKLPQILRAFGVLKYRGDLAERIDNFLLIPAGSREEIEIRAATIWAVELIRRRIPEYSAAQIDSAIWLLSQNPKMAVRPYHRTYTVYY